MPLTPWKYKAGVEMTFQRPLKNAKEFKKWSDGQFWGELSADKYRMQDAIPSDLVYDVKTDPDCVETPTKILKSWNDAEHTISTILSHADRIGMIAKNKGLSTGGGGHVHVSGMNDLTKCATVRDMQNRPYVPWFFADPDTTSQANSVAAIECDLLSRSWDFISKHPTSSAYNFKFIHTHLHYFGTIEFRFFDCFMEYERYEESLAFAQAYVKWIDAQARKGKRFDVVIRNRSDLLHQYNDYVRCLEEFQELIENIGLPWTRYKRYIANLDERFEDENLLR